MYRDHKVIVVLPAYNAAKTLKRTYDEIPHDLVDTVILGDDASEDDTVSIANAIGIKQIIIHSENFGYGANQKSLYQKALSLGGDIIILLHPDYQYTPKLITAMASIIGNGVFPVVLGSRILGTGALKGGMPLYKYVANRVLTFIQNLAVNYKLSEYHTGYRAFHRNVLESIAYESNSDGFLFDNQILSQIIFAGYDIAEISCPARYFPDASSIGFRKALKYGMGVIVVSMQHFLTRVGLRNYSRYTIKRAP